jgi:hypothetical protein
MLHMVLDMVVEEWEGSDVTHIRGSDYRRWTATEFDDKPARLTPRQAVFYRNLIRMAVALQNREIPVDFELPDGRQLYLDRGCIKIAEFAEFIEPIANSPAGTVDRIRLRFRC